MIQLLRTDSDHPDFISLVKELDAELAKIDGDEQHSFYSQFNKITKIKHAVVAYENEIPVGCGAIKEFDAETMEVKRMFVPLDGRNKGIASKVLTELETWAHELSYKRCLLQTGKRQPDAIALYSHRGYNIIPNWGQYENDENSVCFEKILKL